MHMSHVIIREGMHGKGDLITAEENNKLPIILGEKFLEIKLYMA